MKDSEAKEKGAMYGISRVVSPKDRSQAWRVSLTYQGKKRVKNFPDKKYGNKRWALMLAQEYRDGL